jgi:Ca2+-binding RTX toxin-like protein
MAFEPSSLDLGIHGASMFLEHFQNLVEAGADIAFVWPVVHNTQTALISMVEDVSVASVNGLDLVTNSTRAAMFDLLRQTVDHHALVQIDAVGVPSWLELTAFETASPNSDGTTDRVVFLSSRTEDLSAFEIDFRGFAGEAISVMATSIYYHGGGAHRDAIVGEVAVDVDEINGSAITLRPFEVIQFVFVQSDQDDHIDGTNSDEKIRSGGGNDTVFAGLGDDSIIAGTGDDYIVGGAGNDVIEGGAGADILFGGDGLDWASYASSPEGIALRLWNGRGNGGHATGDELSGIENLVGSGFDDLLVGDQFDNYFEGGDGSDALWGNTGDDTLSGGAGPDALHGQDGADWASYASSDASVTIRLWSGRGEGGHAQDDALIGIEHLEGSTFGDLLVGDSFDNTISGEAGNDNLWGNTGNDFLSGGPGEDVLFGQAGNDTLVGGEGDDILVGGEGTDVFVFQIGMGRDTIVDFTEVDVVDVRGVASFQSLEDVLARLEYDDPGINATLSVDGTTIVLSQISAIDFMDAHFMIA